MSVTHYKNHTIKPSKSHPNSFVYGPDDEPNRLRFARTEAEAIADIDKLTAAKADA